MRKNLHPQGDQFLKAVGVSIRLRRRKLSLSQAELGSRCGLHRTYITEVENGLRNVSLLTLLKVSNGLSIEVWKLFRFEASSQS
jgi:transcriptional regulator with XRE-family HTH domain